MNEYFTDSVIDNVSWIFNYSYNSSRIMNRTTEYGIHRDARISVVLIVSILIICSNILNLSVLRVTHQIPTISRLCLLNLSCADLLVGVVACAPSVYPAITGQWPYGTLCCQIAGIVHGMSVTVSIWSLAMVSIDRYVAIIHPLKYPLMLTPLRCKLTLTAMWILAFCTFFAPLPTKPNFVYYRFNPVESMCGMHWEYPWFCVITGVYIPILSGLVLLVSTVRVSKKIVNMKKKREEMIHPQMKQHKPSSQGLCLRSRSSHHGSPYLPREQSTSKGPAYTSCLTAQRSSHSHDTSSTVPATYRTSSHVQLQRLKISKASTNLRDLKVVKVLAITSMVYFAAWGPYVLNVMMLSFIPSFPTNPFIMFSFIWLANSNSFMNVIIYSVMYASFRRTIVRTVTKCF